MQKNVQISSELLVDLVDYFQEDNPAMKDLLQNRIITQLTDKLNRLQDREIYTKYKTSSTQAEREKYRLQYLDSKGISSGFRTEQEVSYRSPDIRSKNK